MFDNDIIVRRRKLILSVSPLTKPSASAIFKILARRLGHVIKIKHIKKFAPPKTIARQTIVFFYGLCLLQSKESFVVTLATL